MELNNQILFKEVTEKEFQVYILLIDKYPKTGKRVYINIIIRYSRQV